LRRKVVALAEGQRSIMDDSPLVSIIIPSFNAARWLGEAIESALAQTWPHTEVIVVDDGSTDESLGIARRFESRGVRVLAQSNRGASAARNAGWRAARGDYLQFLDADDLLAPDKLERQLDRLRELDPVIVAAGSWGIFHEIPADAVFTPQAVWNSMPPVDWLVSSWSGGGMMHPAAWLTPRTVAERAGPWNEKLSLDDDGEFFCRVLLASPGVGFVPEARSYYRAHTGVRLSASGGERAWDSSFATCHLKEQALLAVENSPRSRHACACNYSRFAWEHYPEAGAVVDQAVARWYSLDASVPPPSAGRNYNRIARLLGWRMARRLQKLCRSRPF
jgi:hypothetical protein